MNLLSLLMDLSQSCPMSWPISRGSIGQSKIPYGFRLYETRLYVIFSRILGEERARQIRHIGDTFVLLPSEIVLLPSPFLYTYVSYKLELTVSYEFHLMVKRNRRSKLRDKIRFRVRIAAAISRIRLSMAQLQLPCNGYYIYVCTLIASIEMFLSRRINLLHVSKQSNPANCRNSEDVVGKNRITA